MVSNDILLTDLISPLAEALGYELGGIEHLSHSKQPVVRIYIDSADGIGVDDCSKLSRQLISMFDVENPIKGEYVLEVSSPGMDRPLFTLQQCVQHVGEQVKISTF